MLIKIKGRNKELFESAVIGVMNLACVAFRRGNIPTEYEMANPEATGMYWYENEKENKFELLPTSNNYKSFIRERGDNYIVVEFYSKYDLENKQVNALSELILAFFDRDLVELAS